MDMIVHQAECKDYDRILPDNQINAVHRQDKILFVPEQDVLNGSIR